MSGKALPRTEKNGNYEKGQLYAALIIGMFSGNMLFFLRISAFPMLYILFVLRKGTFVPYLIEPVYQLQLVVRELVPRGVDYHVLEAVVGE